MTAPVRSWRLAWRVLTLALVLAAIPLPGLAGDSSQQVAKPGIRASAEKVASTARLADSAGQAAPGGKAQLNSPSFFKSTAGIVVLAVVGAGVGYAVYSSSHDRIHSVVRANQ